MTRVRAGRRRTVVRTSRGRRRRPRVRRRARRRVHRATNLNRAYYGTDTRAYELLAGAFLALTPRLFRLGRPRATRRSAVSSRSAAWRR